MQAYRPEEISVAPVAAVPAANGIPQAKELSDIDGTKLGKTEIRGIATGADHWDAFLKLGSFVLTVDRGERDRNSCAAQRESSVMLVCCDGGNSSKE
jgi:hypothetical protein